jgi:hypothetical protein
VLAYLSWHRPAVDVDPAAYEQALVRLHRSLEHRPPSGFRGSAAFRSSELPWIAPVPGGAGAGYEDWYLVDGWSALGVLEEAAVSRGHVTRHDAVAAMAGVSSGGVYRLSEGHPALGEARVSVWIARAPGHTPMRLGELLGDGMDRARSGLWRRCLGLGPAPEHCLLAPEAPAGVAATRLPAGWCATVGSREALFAG